MRTLVVVLLGCGSLVLNACATEGPPPESAGPIAEAPLDLGASSYGQFLAGQSAANHGENTSAAAFFGKAAVMESGEEHALLDTRAFTSALLAGDIPRAASAAPTGANADVSMRRLGALVRGVDALASGKGRLARAILTGPDSAATNEPAAALLSPFAAAAAGDGPGSIVQPLIKGEPIAQFFANLDQGKLFEHAHRYDEAETAFRALIAKGDPGGIASLNLGAMLERRGRPADAEAIYVSALGRKSGDPDLSAARDRAHARSPAPPLPSLKASAAEALIATASSLLLEKHEEIALAYLRLALRLDGARDEAWMLVGDILTSNNDDPGAREAYAHVSPGSAQYLTARMRLAWNSQNAGDKDTALAVARETLAMGPGRTDALINLADLLRANEHYEESAKILDGVIGAKPESADWKLLYMRAVDEQESGRWAEAERDLQIALKLRPDEAELLNFLGYAWIDRGVRLPEAMGMVQRAVNLQPQSGAMLDSLGWGYFKMGDYATAVTKLEAAVALEAGDPDVNDHLGDAYWRVGRKVEAVFQWRRVLTLDPSAKLKAAVEVKLAAEPRTVAAIAPVVAAK